MTKLIFRVLLLFVIASVSCDSKIEPYVEQNYDIVVYGGTSAGVVAAIQSARLGKKVLLIAENENKLGGLTTNGLGNTDIGLISSVGGIASEFYGNVGKYYDKTTSIIQFEPSVAKKVFNEMLTLTGKNITVLYYNERVNPPIEVIKDGNQISAILVNINEKITAKVFIDTSYEGDLMDKSMVKYFVGREANTTYGETLNGITNPDLSWPVNPYIDVSNTVGQLLPRVQSSLNGKVGDSDSKIQAYNYRLCMTRKPENRIMIEKPMLYNPLNYELLIRMANKKPNNAFLSVVALANGKYDVNNEGFISTDLPSINYEYPNGTFDVRKQIEDTVKDYMMGFIWTLQNDTRIPEVVRNRYKDLGLARDEFVLNSNWPYMIYIREGRRMVGEYVMKESDILVGGKVYDSIGLGSYNLDCHAVQFVLSFKNTLAVEGGIFKPVVKPYSISYRSILPKKEECSNLLVPVCMSASHVAYSSLRMEPVYMILAQSAAVAASLSIENKVMLHDIDYSVLREKLISLGQKL